MNARCGIAIASVGLLLGACKPSSSPATGSASSSTTPLQLPAPLDAAPVMRNPEVIHALHHDTSPALRSIPPVQREEDEALEHEVDVVKPLPLPARAPETNGPLSPSPLAPGFTTHAPLQIASFDGIGNGLNGFTVNAAPPDTNGDVGPNHYVQIVNTALAVFNKSTGAVILAPVAIKTLWAGFGGLCETDNDGDPVANYDPIADRWVLSQFAVTGGPNFLECVAVSTTPDPTGSYNRYSFAYTGFPDYPKISVWPDAYYVTFNMFNASGTAFLGGKTCAFDRTKMLVGQAATQQCFDVGTSFGGLLDADLDGPTLPPAGSPNPILSIGALTNQLAFWKFHVDFTTPANSTLTGPTNITINNITFPCGGTAGACVPQSGGASSNLDTLSDRLMYRLAYRNFGDHEALVVDHTVDVSGKTGVRWYELRLDASHNASLFQQGTYAPDSTNWRWMGSTAIDKYGNIAIGFNRSSSTTHPGIFYTGRLPVDAAGTLSQGESNLFTGGGSQGPGLDRWGDYSALMVDPSDDCTFWYTTEYIPANGTFNWKTRIGSFRLPGCGSDFSISTTPGSRTAVRGGTANYSVSTTLVSNPAETVTFSASGLPSGVTAAFVPTAATAGSGSTLTLTVGGAVTFGTYSITVTGAAPSGSHATTVSLKVDAPPVANADSYVATKDTALVVGAPGVLGNDTDPESDPLSAAVVSAPAHGTLALAADGSFTYTPAAGYFGADSFVYSASDGTLSSNATVSLTVNGRPTAVADSYSVAKNGSLSVTAPGVLSNDTDPEASALTAVLSGAPAHGTATLNTDGSFVYTPAAGYSGPDSFTYFANDGSINSSSAATVSITVDAPPNVTGDSYSLLQDSTLTVAAPGILANDSDPEANPFHAALGTSVTHGTLVLSTNGGFTYTPAPGYYGADSFTYVADDGIALSSPATVSIMVVPVITAAADSYEVVSNGTLTIAAPGVLSNDVSGGGAMSASVVTDVTHGTLALSSDGSFLYSPAAGYSGNDSFVYRASDGSGMSDATVTLRVDAPPVANDDSFSVLQNGMATAAAPGVLGNDTDADLDPLTASVAGAPAHGTLTLFADGSWDYTPTPGFSGPDSFTYIANDGFADSAAATVSITVVHVNEAPIAAADAYSVNEDGTLTVAAPGVLANDTDPEADPLTAVQISAPVHGTFALSAEGSFTWAPPALFHGTDSFSYQAYDGALASGTVTVSLTVVHVNHLPVAQADEYQTEIDTTLHGIASHGLLLNDSDLDGETLTASADAQPLHGTLTLTSDGTFIYAPESDVSGDDAFTYRAWDGTATSAPATVTIHIGGVDRPPARPVPVSPAYGNRLALASQHFEWLASDDGDTNDAITYRLRVLKGSATVVDTTLTALTLDLDAATKLAAGRYSWQIEAVDAHGVVSGPTSPIAFDVASDGGGGSHGGCRCSTMETSTKPSLGVTLLSGLALVVVARKRRSNR